MRVLVAYGTKTGGTAGIADMIGTTLAGAGLHVDVSPAEPRMDIAGYDAVIVGGGLYAGRWHRPFLKQHAAMLRTKPVWLFSSGPLDDSASVREIPPVRWVQRWMERIGARGHATFGGRLLPDANGFVASAMAKTRSGDWRGSCAHPCVGSRHRRGAAQPHGRRGVARPGGSGEAADAGPRSSGVRSFAPA
jgi:menaquinone-dependent protoporphyrinogen oxidase